MIDLKTPILNESGKPVEYAVPTDIKDKDGKIKKSTVMTVLLLKKVLRQVLLDSNGETNPVTVTKRYDLFMKIRDLEEVEFTEEETKILEVLLPQKFDVIISGQVINILNNK